MTLMRGNFQIKSGSFLKDITPGLWKLQAFYPLCESFLEAIPPLSKKSGVKLAGVFAFAFSALSARSKGRTFFLVKLGRFLN